MENLKRIYGEMNKVLFSLILFIIFSINGVVTSSNLFNTSSFGNIILNLSKSFFPICITVICIKDKLKVNRKYNLGGKLCLMKKH